MTRISSGSTSFYKRVLPAMFFGIAVLIVVTAVMSGAVSKNVLTVAMPCAIAVFGFVFFKRNIWLLADEVDDGDDFLVVRRRGVEERIPLTNIMNVSVSTTTKPPRVTLRLVQPGRLGREVAFSPVTPFTLVPETSNAVAESLIDRVYRATRRA